MSSIAPPPHPGRAADGADAGVADRVGAGAVDVDPHLGAAGPAAGPAPSGDELQADADTAWALALGLLDPTDDDAAGAAPVTVSPFPSSPDADLDRLEASSIAQHRAAADEYRVIARLVSDAATGPTPWVGDDPTIDRAWTDSRQRSVAAVRRDRLDLAERAVVAEIAVRLHLSEQTVRTRAAHAEILARRCPRVWESFAAGGTSERHATEAARLAASLPDDVAAWALFDQGAVGLAAVLTPAKFAVAARALRERVHTESREARHRRAARDRGVWLTPDLDGMATLSALLPADRAQTVLAHVDAIARTLRGAPDDERTLAQLRADVLSDLAGGDAAHAGVADALDASTVHPDTVHPDTADGRPPTPTTAPVAVSGARPSVAITIPALTLLGASDDPATLDGYGPIDLDTAKRLAGEASSWVRILTHPVTGATLALDRSTYRVPAALRRWLGHHGPTCSFPGCRRPTRECDMDHLEAWAEGGATDADNLAPECRHHHRLRHGTRWRPSRAPDDGALSWTSPLGREIAADPPPF